MNYTDEIVTRCAPRWAWEVIDQSLILDSASISTDRETRHAVSDALEAMIRCCDEIPD